MTGRMSTQRVGSISEHLAAARLMVNGYEVFWPAQDGGRFDLLIRSTEGDFKKVQVKTASWITPRGSPHLRSLVVDVSSGSLSKRRTYSPTDFDLLAAVCSTDDRVWLIPMWENNAVPGYRRFTLDSIGEHRRPGARHLRVDSNQWLLPPRGAMS